tara:strand:+ start:112 stop:285 length:174 start_codon:yes stop_codon:yes gene_type:complete
MISYEEAMREYLDNLKEDDYDFYWNASDKKLMKDFYHHCSMYEDLKHLIKKREVNND